MIVHFRRVCEWICPDKGFYCQLAICSQTSQTAEGMWRRPIRRWASVLALSVAKCSIGAGYSGTWVSVRVNECYQWFFLKYIFISDQAFISPALYICSGVDGHVTRTATGYACGFCRKEFVKGSNCRRHVKETHLSMGQFSCPYCNKNFHRSKVQNHINGCSGNINYS